jgi:catechol 2,3-dioxygenase-like lactoylglutathione lyase family enzyme
MSVDKIHHGGLTVKNLKESIKFYEKLLGLKKVDELEVTIHQEGDFNGATIKVAFLKAGVNELELLEYVHPTAKKNNDLNPWDMGSVHISFAVKNVQKLYDKYKSKIDFLSPPIHSKAEGRKSIWTYFRDLNGSLIELSQDNNATDCE